MKIAKYLNKKKIGGLILIIVIVIAFGFGGFGGGFMSNNQNNIAKINKTNISTQEFIDYINTTNISQQVIKENLNNNIIQELLSGLISTTLLNLEINDFQIFFSKNSMLKKIKENKNFIDENGVFKRTMYEKFLLENNISATIFEQRLKNRELQKNLFDYIGAGTVSPKFLISKLYKDENRKLELDFIDLDKFYKKENEINNQDLINFIENNNDELKVEYLDFKYSIINPQNLIGVDEFNQAFFDKIDKIETDILNGVNFETLVTDLKLKVKNIDGFKYSEESTKIEKKIYEAKDNRLDIFENGDNFVIYSIKNIEKKKPDIRDEQIRTEITKLVTQKNKFDYNINLLEKIRDKKFSNNDFLELGNNNIKTITLNSIKDNSTFDIKSVEMLYSLPINNFTLISDKNDNIYLTKIKNFKNKAIDIEAADYKSYINKENSNNRNNILKSYDLFLNNKYNVVINKKTIDRVKNFFQ